MQRGTGMALFAMGLGVLVIANDFTALNVALPAIEEDFGVDVGTIQWTINAYALTFGMVLVTGGRLADMFGRRKVFFIGTAIFAFFSLLGGFAQNAEQLIAMRVGMGIGGGLMWPAILGMTFAAVPASRAAFAGGMILGVAGLGNALGPLIGGLLTDELSWRAIFFLNLPIAAFAVAVTAAKLHQPHDDSARERIDYAGIVSLSLGLVLLLLALDQSAEWGWGDSRVLAMVAVSLASFAAFALIEPRMGTAALVPSDVIANRRFTAACLTVLCLSAVFFSAILYGPQLMEKILGYSALEAGLGMLPMLGTFGAVAFASDRIVARVGMRAVIVAGTAMLAVGPLALSLFGVDSGYAVLLPGTAADRSRGGALLPDDHHRGRRPARRVAVEPRRRDHLHVPGRRRRDRARADDDDLHPALRGRGDRRRGVDRAQPRRAAVGGHPRRARRDRGGREGVLGLRHLDRGQAPRRGRGVVRRRGPAQLPGRRGDCPDRVGDRDRRRQARAAIPGTRLTPRRSKYSHSWAPSSVAGSSP